MNTQETENNYSQLTQEILQKDWKKFLKLMKVLKYSSPGEYLRLFYEDEKLFLKSNDHYLRSNFIIRKNNLIIGKTIPWPITDWRPLFIRKVLFFKYEKLFDELHAEIRKQEFLNPINSTIDLELKIIQYKRLFQFLLSRKNMYWTKVQLEIEDMTLLLQERILKDKNEVSNIEKSLIPVPEPLNKNTSKDEPPFHYLVDGIKLNNKPINATRKLNRLGKFLVQEKFINEEDLEAFICLFQRNSVRVNFKSKVVWNSHLIALIFLFKSLMVYGVIKDHRTISKKLSIAFLNNNNGEPLTNDDFHHLIGVYKFRNMNVKEMSKWVEENGNENIRKIYQELRRIYFNDLDLL
ncbi:hypothetical protein [Fluviicola sp.]|uniref:hypothetical protein n=1 Tax=Fluviicola sp. TaxID=1917219 RepID=UPI0031D80EDA